MEELVPDGDSEAYHSFFSHLFQIPNVGSNDKSPFYKGCSVLSLQQTWEQLKEWLFLALHAMYLSSRNKNKALTQLTYIDEKTLEYKTKPPSFW